MTEMKRRSFIAGVGVVACGTGALAAPAAPAPATPTGARPPYKALAEASAKCLKAGQECLRKSFERLAAKDPSLIDCARSASDVVAACASLSGLAAVGAPFALGFARTVADVALACKKDCDRFPQIAECQALSAACAACADECRKTAG
jgi:Cys-rich four helix bundle protein (predicted Tat secretion target)